MMIENVSHETLGIVSAGVDVLSMYQQCDVSHETFFVTVIDYLEVFSSFAVLVFSATSFGSTLCAYLRKSSIEIS